MATKASPTAIGGFVVGAIALIIVGLIVFGGGQFFTKSAQFVTYFPGSVQGLRVGAPVTFRGAQIGQVTNISVVITGDESHDLVIPVVFELVKDKFNYAEGAVSMFDDLDTIEDMQKSIGAGLRAQLQTQSMVTGLLYVDLGFQPDTEPRLVGTSGALLEIPAIASTLEEVQQNFGTLMQDVPGLVANMNTLLTTIDSEVGSTSGKFEKILANLEEITSGVTARGEDLNTIIADAAATMETLRNSADIVDAILVDNQETIGTLLGELTEAVSSVRRMADQINNAVAENREGLQDFTSTGLYEWTGLAQDAQAAVAQIQRVAEELERNPARFLFGGQETGMRPEE